MFGCAPSPVQEEADISPDIGDPGLGSSIMDGTFGIPQDSYLPQPAPFDPDPKPRPVPGELVPAMPAPLQPE
ncbi:hypothetical protein [Mangrovicoccus sp. HB161399]|uniref:hypothetical protein n=1 Tax=Mangrovicoccus sp. HB161399 TaxID=2720392 RepID=UPI00155208FD|nr:hypothetical protein [Mangrovicoccus sp. HB161399]